MKATFERLLAKETASPKAGDYKALKSVEALDDYTLVFHLTQPNSPFLATLASGWSAILPKSLIDAGHDFANKPVCTGPFSCVEWVRDSKVVLKKNPNYWMKGLPKLDGGVINIITEQSVMLQGLLGGQIHGAYPIDNKDRPTLEKDPGTKVDVRLSAMDLVMSINCSRPQLSKLGQKERLTVEARYASLESEPQRQSVRTACAHSVRGSAHTHGDPHERGDDSPLPVQP